jgi:membrane protease YdiL (CAAX protease family)
MESPLDPQQPPIDSADLEPEVYLSQTVWPAPPLATEAELHAHKNGVFFGRYGMRAGWGMLIFVAVFLLLTVIAAMFSLAATGKMHEVMAARAFAHAHPNLPKPRIHMDFVPRFVIVNDGITFLGLLGACFLFSKAERRPLRAYGIGSYRVRDILPGAFWGLAMMSVLIAVLYSAHLLVFDGRNEYGTHAILYGIGWLIAFLAVGFSEEYIFRGYLQYTLMRGVIGLAERISATNARVIAFWIAATILSLQFAFAHMGNGGETFFGLVQVFIAGITFAYALWRTGSLWWGIGFHMTWDWAQSFLFGVADSGNVSVGRLFTTHAQGKTIFSGGPTGPEGSIFATVALLLTIVVIYFTHPGMQPALEQEPKPVDPKPIDPSVPPSFHSEVV